MLKQPKLSLAALLLAQMAGTAAEPAQAGASEPKEKGTAGRIAIRGGSFFDVGTGRAFRPVEVNYYRLGLSAEGNQSGRGQPSEWQGSALENGVYAQALL